APRPISRRANRLAAASSSAKLTGPSCDHTAVCSGAPATAADSNCGSRADEVSSPPVEPTPMSCMTMFQAPPGRTTATHGARGCKDFSDGSGDPRVPAFPNPLWAPTRQPSIKLDRLYRTGSRVTNEAPAEHLPAGGGIPHREHEILVAGEPGEGVAV